MTCHGRFVIETSWSRAKRKNLRRRWPSRISKASCHSHKHSVGNSRAFSEVLLGLGLCQSVTPRGALFSENSKSHVILEVFWWALNCFVVVACAGDLWDLGTEQQPKFQSTRKTRGPTLVDGRTPSSPLSCS